jgi:signal transduction histidine kinase
VPGGSELEGTDRAQVELVIRDNGRGFDLDAVPTGRLGLGIIRERAQAIGATLEIDTEFGCGTQIRVIRTCTDLRAAEQVKQEQVHEYL